jgi:hypothetical protein
MLDRKGRALTFRQLQERGWPYTRQHTHRLVKAGKLTSPFKAYDGGRVNLYDERELAAFLREVNRITHISETT